MNTAIKIYIYFIALLLIGSIFVYSASSFTGYIYHKNSSVFFFKQIIAIALAIIISFLFSYIPSSFFKKNAHYLFFLILILNILTFIPYIKYPINGAMRWIKFGGIIFQPSELIKFSYFLNIAQLFYIYEDQIQYALSFIVFYFLLTLFILINQSDFGLSIIISAITFILLWNFLYNKKILLYGIIFIAFLLILFIAIKPYRIMRLITYLNPWNDPLGKGFQIIQSYIAIYNGGYYGVGLGNSIQKNLFLPMAHTDFLFSIIVEEIGLVGSICLIFLLFRFSLFFIKKSIKSNIFNKNFLLSTGLLIIIQSSINIGAATGIIPTKGIGLPFISYGMSSIISFAILIGIAMSMIKETK